MRSDERGLSDFTFTGGLLVHHFQLDVLDAVSSGSMSMSKSSFLGILKFKYLNGQTMLLKKKKGFAPIVRKS